MTRHSEHGTANMAPAVSPADSPAVSPGRPIDALEAEITEQAAHLHAGMCRFLGLVGEFDRREGWAAWGCRSCAHWLSWRCGIALGPAREQVRVARALEGLPLVRAAFSRGELSYSKIRALTRIATPAIESDLVAMAQAATASQLERIVRGFRGAVSMEEANQRHEGRYLRWYTDEDGSVVIRARLTPEEGELVVQAVQAAIEAKRSARRALRAEAVGSGGTGDASDGDAASGRHAEAGRGVPAGMPSHAPSDVSAETSVENPVDPRGAERADALGLLAETFLASGPVPLAGGERHRIVVHVDALTLAGGASGSTEHGWPTRLGDAGGVPAETSRRLACDASVVALLEGADGDPLSVGRRTRSIPPSIRRALRSRDLGCRFPGCSERMFVDGHHVRHWAHGGETSLKNLVELCRFHHRAVHEGGYSIRVRGPGRFTFRRSDGRAIPDVVAPPTADSDGVRHANRKLDIRIDAETPVALWDGSRPDYGWAVEGLLARAGPIPAA